LEPKQTQIEQLVVDYFRQRSDTDVFYDEAGGYKVVLNSTSARQHFSDSGQLSLIFDGARLAENPDSELITATHPFLDVIRDDLESDHTVDPRLGEAHIVLQLLSPAGRLTVPELVFSKGQQQVQYMRRFAPTFVLTYRVIYDTDERTENIVRLCYNAATGEMQSDLLLRLKGSFITDGRPDQAEGVECLSLDRILEAGRLEVEARILADVKLIGHQISARLADDRKRLETHYKAELDKLRTHDIVGCQRLKETLEKDIEELKQKYACGIKVELLSVLKLWWPIVDYTVTVRGQRKRLLIEDIRYDSQAGRTEFEQCPKCGNHTCFDICVVGQHISCGGECSQGITECATCHDPMCPEHGGPCHDCKQPVCEYDRRECSYGKHEQGTYYCPKCLVESFEDKPLCKACLEYCDACKRPFAHEHMSTCRLGGERICLDHDANPCGHECEECHQTPCETHSAKTAEGTWVCTDHGATSSCCRQIFALGHLEACCVDKDEALCPDHRFYCADCGKAVCETHSAPLYGRRRKRVCDNCRVTCDLCGPKRSYISRDLAQCVVCGKAVCDDHRRMCAVCGNAVCREDVVVSAEGEDLCPSHAGTCELCEPDNAVHRTEALKPCAICGASTCSEHRVLCEVCQRTYIGLPHVAQLPRCPSCGRFSCATDGCSTEMQTCSACGMAYCMHCFTSSGQCTACASVAKSKVYRLSQETISLLGRVIQTTTGQPRDLLGQMLRYAPHIRARKGENQTYRALVLRCDPPLLQKLVDWSWSLPNKQIRIVVDAKGKVMSIKVEAAK